MEEDVHVIMFRIVHTSTTSTSTIKGIRHNVVGGLAPFQVDVSFQARTNMVVCSAYLPTLLGLCNSGNLPLPIFGIELVSFPGSLHNKAFPVHLVGVIISMLKDLNEGFLELAIRCRRSTNQARAI